MNHSDMLCGVFAPIVTPFTEDDRVSIPDLVENLEKYNETDLKGYMPLGSNGEFQGLTDEESFEILDAVTKTKARGKVIVAGCGRESSYKTVEFIKKAADHGIDMAFVIPPHYFVDRMTDEALLAYYTDVADKSPVPIVVYNAPKFAFNLLISVDLMRALAPHPNIIAMKNSSMHPNADYLAAIDPKTDFCLIAGNIKTFYPGIRDGAIGGVLSTASWLPEYCCRLFEHFQKGDHEKAQKLHDYLNALSANTVGKHGVAGVKMGLDLRGFKGGRPRLPLLPVPPDEVERIAQVLKKEGIPRF